MVDICGLSSYVIWAGDGGGDVETKSTMFSSIEVVVLFTFFDRPYFAPASTNRLNCVSTDTLFDVASSMISTVVTSSSSSYSNSEMISLRFPFPCSWSAFLFLKDSTSFTIFLYFSFVIVYSGSSDSMSSSSSSFLLYWLVELILFLVGLVTYCSAGVFPLWVGGGMIVICSLLVSSIGISSDMKVLICNRSS